MGRRHLLWLVARIAAAAVLIAAGSLKLFAGSGSFEPGPVVLEPHVVILVATAELVLGAWLLSGWSTAVARPVAVAAFAGFAAMSGWLAWVGAAECGCFGSVRVSPIVSAAIDVTLAAALLTSRSAVRRPADWKATDFVVPVVVAAVLGIGAYTAGVYQYGSAASAVARLRGESAHLDSAVLDFGDGRPGDSRERSASVTNLTDRPLCILGGSVDCSCTAVAGLPVTIPPFESRTLTVGLRFIGATAGRQVHEVTYTTDDLATPTLRLWLVARLNTPGAVPGE